MTKQAWPACERRNDHATKQRRRIGGARQAQGADRRCSAASAKSEPIRHSAEARACRATHSTDAGNTTAAVPTAALPSNDFPIGWHLQKSSWHFPRRFFAVFKRPMEHGPSPRAS